MKISRNTPQEELEVIVDKHSVDTEEYKRANDLILRIQLDTDNKQTANLIEEVREESRSADKHARWAIYVAIVTLGVGIFAAYQQIQSNNLTQRTLELSAEPALTITLDASNLPDNTDVVLMAAGLIPLNDSNLNLVLTNNSPSSVEQVDLRMTLWQLFVNEGSKHLTVCPLGYVDHNDNPHFTLSHLGTSNLLSNRFGLGEGERYPLALNLKNLSKIELIPSASRILLKIDVSFVKTVSQTNHSYIKLFVLNSFGGDVLDPDVSPTLAMGLADRKEEIDWEGFKFPSILHPFEQEEFLRYFDVLTPDLDLTPSGCREFQLSKEVRTIYY